MDCLTEDCEENSIKDDDVPMYLSPSDVSLGGGLSSRGFISSNGAASSGCCSGIVSSSSDTSVIDGISCSTSFVKLSVSSYVFEGLNVSEINVP